MLNEILSFQSPAISSLIFFLIAITCLSFALFYFSRRALARKVDELRNVQNELLLLNQQNAQLKQDSQHQKELAASNDELKELLNNERVMLARAQAQNEAQQNRINALLEAHEDKINTMAESERRLQTQFENLANKIFEEKQNHYTQQTKHNIEAVLAPFKSDLEGFKRQISEQHIREGQERASLKTEILGLKELNQKITAEAAALTNALKGDNKKQGNWGEVVLERILKESGLREGHEFDTQVNATSYDGKRYQPDVVVHLPNDKDVIIDSKVSLAAYERYFNCEDDNERSRYLVQHVASIKGHIKGLGNKDYQALKEIKTLDYVLLFIPIEAAFLLAVEEEPDLVTMALNNNIMLVSPTNLLVALRTINNIWQYEYQNQNAQQIAEQGAKLYDKFVGFITEMEKVGKSLDNAHASYQGAMNKLNNGRGNIVRQVEKLRELGVQPNKKLSENYQGLTHGEQ
ncbi:DNA recombination protein RmuC [Alteromonas sp. KUL42]|uniref:DNA recombination protein RmuC n=1 Tax=Alteromonas sp. KUL42 TaxID=2480797 RepID=UPI001035BA22|nr:DNA recombination protein RmuC [Alteromonas sp. KUL42]TAP36528.1 DNA recombination protein RmuC [Alteromonas sp. KUL42]GEA06727.1 DNA recombination protein RmuC [Alteromonas sp. KUL42]